jgi:hypothetical protein
MCHLCEFRRSTSTKEFFGAGGHGLALEPAARFITRFAFVVCLCAAAAGNISFFPRAWHYAFQVVLSSVMRDSR